MTRGLSYVCHSTTTIGPDLLEERPRGTLDLLGGPEVDSNGVWRITSDDPNADMRYSPTLVASLLWLGSQNAIRVVNNKVKECRVVTENR